MLSETPLLLITVCRVPLGFSLVLPAALRDGAASGIASPPGAVLVTRGIGGRERRGVGTWLPSAVRCFAAFFCRRTETGGFFPVYPIYTLLSGE